MKIDTYKLQSFFKTALFFAVIGAILFLFCWERRQRPQSVETPIVKPNYEISEMLSGEVVRVVDGDTFVILIGNKEAKIRLIGVDTPESVAPANYYEENTENGFKISAFVEEKVKSGDLIYMEFDKQRKDKYGRTLAYLYLANGEMLQEWLLSNGYAETMEISPNTRYSKYFDELMKTATENKVGLWQESEVS